MLGYALLVPAFVGAAFACSDAKTDAKALDGKWNIVEAAGERVTAEELPFLEFDMAEKRLHGNAGCNIVNTTVSLDPKDISAITIAQGAVTMMACPEMDLEMKVLRAMDQVRSVKNGRDADEMLLLDEAGKVVLRLDKE